MSFWVTLRNASLTLTAIVATSLIIEDHLEGAKEKVGSSAGESANFSEIEEHIGLKNASEPYVDTWSGSERPAATEDDWAVEPFSGASLGAPLF